MSNGKGTKHLEDRALNAVRRVRESREKDSRFGLQHALAVVRTRQAELQEAAERRAAADGFTQGTPGDFAAHLSHLALLADLESRATVAATDSRLIADEATHRWQRDRQQVRVVDGLLQRRAAVRAEERARREAHELDDLATQAWLRRTAADISQQARPRHDRTEPVEVKP